MFDQIIVYGLHIWMQIISIIKIVSDSYILLFMASSGCQQINCFFFKGRILLLLNFC